MSHDLLNAFGKAEESDDDFGDFEEADRGDSRGDEWISGESGTVLFDADEETAKVEGADKVGADKVGADKVGADKVGADKVGADKVERAEKQTVKVTLEDDSFFADWEPASVTESQVKGIVPLQPATKVLQGETSREAGHSQDQASSQTSSKPTTGPPPTNLPPPSVFLAYITSMYETLPSQLKQLTTSASLDRIPRLQSSTACLRASARVIAGRRLRWKRDIILAQSMKIGPAGSAGVKVSNLDKNEAVREDREIAEAVHTWKRHVGSLRLLIGKANSQNQGLDLMLPEISESMSVRKGKESEGALSAKKCCIVCGLNRDERVGRLDLFVEDSFGEWWMEHWGHVDCVVFWDVCKDDLPQR